ncbi:MAG: amino acid aminotransferase [Pseudomonadota bacterium]
MFSTLDTVPADPVLGLSAEFAADARAEKVNLGAGVFRTPDGRTPVMKAVEQAQRIIVENEATKVYLPQRGAPGFDTAIIDLLFGEDRDAVEAGRVVGVQAPGGTGALRVGAGLLLRGGVENIALTDPTWPNHAPVMASAGLTVKKLPYYDTESNAVDFDAFAKAVSALGEKDALLLHGACHNPTGADLTDAQIDTIFDLALEKGFFVFIDTAYHGFGDGLEADAQIVRKAATRLPETIVAYSCSKNFGLYRERTGAVLTIGKTAEDAKTASDHVMQIARANYSLSPAHGGVIVTEILNSAELTALWRDELASMAAVVNDIRASLVDELDKLGLGNRLAYIKEQRGMFTLLPLSREAVAAAKKRHGVYLVGSGRINVCGLNDNNVALVAKAIADVIEI